MTAALRRAINELKASPWGALCQAVAEADREVSRLTAKVDYWALKADIHRAPSEATKRRYTAYLVAQDAARKRKADLLAQLKASRA